MSNNMVNYTTAVGKSIRLKGLPSMLIEKIQSSVIIPDPPTYTATTVGGDVETHFHNETTLDVEDDAEQTAKNHKAWEEYILERNRINAELSERMMKLMLIKGTEVEMPTDDEWIEEQAFVGADISKIPEDHLGRKYYYIVTEVIGSPDDLNYIMETIMRISGVSGEAIASAESSFRRAMEEAKVNES